MTSGRRLNTEKIKAIDEMKASKDNQLAILTKIKEVIDIPGLTNKERIQLYGSIRRLRKACGLKPGDYDALGCNLLHWAVKSNRVEEVHELVSKYERSEGDREQGADMNALISIPWNLIRNMTPLWIAAKSGYSNIVLLLLKNQAELLIAPEEYVSSYLGSGWYTKSTPLVEAYNQEHKEIVKLLEQPTLDAYTKLRHEHPREYKTTTSVLGLFNKDWGHSKTDKLKAAQAFQVQLAAKDCTQEALEAIEKSHPAVNDGELGSIYKTSLGIRRRS